MEKADYTISPGPDGTPDDEVREFIRNASLADNRELVWRKLLTSGGKCTPARFSARWQEAGR